MSVEITSADVSMSGYKTFDELNKGIFEAAKIFRKVSVTYRQMCMSHIHAKMMNTIITYGILYP